MVLGTYNAGSGSSFCWLSLAEGGGDGLASGGGDGLGPGSPSWPIGCDGGTGARLKHNNKFKMILASVVQPDTVLVQYS